jgi:serine/threonine protein kinase
MQTLQQGTLLRGGKYRVVKVLGQGGFGITYLAKQGGLEKKVAIKEFFMKDLCNRDEATSHVSVGSTGSVDMVERFKAKFLKEARRMHELKHPNIVGVLDIFEENGTAYYVMEYAENGSLVDKLKREGRLAEDVAVKYILQIANALLYIHNQELNHLDIKPANIVLTAENKPMLIDFGLSKHYDLATGSQTSTTPVGISEGYAPMEQYRQGGVGTFSPETDIYSLGATLYKLITGVTPPSAPDLIDNGGFTIKSLKEQGFSSKVASVISKSMKIRKTDRTKSVQVFITGLEGLPTSPKTPIFNTDDEETRPLVSQEQKEAEARAKAGAERRRREEEERKRQEDERKRRVKEKQGDYSGLAYLSLLVILLLLCILDPLGLIHLKSGLLDNSFGFLIYLVITVYGGVLICGLLGSIFRRK